MLRVVVLALVVMSAGIARAAPTRKVRIETEPAGAVVYIGDKENGPACEPTPCSIDAPVGDTDIIIELADHTPVFHTISVPRRGLPKLDTFTLEKAIGKLIFEGPAGAKIDIDGEDKGEAPTEVELPAGPYTVTLTLGGKTGQAFITVESGGEVTVPASTLSGEDAPASDEEKPTATPPVARPARGPIVQLGVSGSSGFRSFTYANNGGASNQRNMSEGGTVLGLTAQVWPTAPFGIARGLFLRAKLEFPPYRNQVNGADLSDQAETLWQHFEVGAHYQFILKEKLGIQVGIAWMRDDFEYSGTQADREILPRAIYTNIAIGGQLSYRGRLGEKWALEPYLAGENRIVTSAGVLEQRYSNTDTTGLAARLGVLATRGRLAFRLELGLLRYSWAFVPSAERMATTATDSTKLLGFGVGYQY